VQQTGNEDRYRVLFEHSSTPMTLTDRQLTIILANARAASLFGLSRDQVEGRLHWGEVLSAGDTEQLKNLAAHAVAASSDPTYLRVRLLGASGDPRDVFLESVVLPDDGGMLVSLTEADGDSEESREARHQYGVFRSLFANSSEGIMRLDLAGRIADVNPAFVRMFGFRRDELIGRRPVDVIVPPSLKAEGERALEKTIRGGGVALGRTTRLRADGREVLVSILGTPVVVDGRYEGAFGIYRDVTGQHQVQDRLADAFIDLVETTSRAMASTDPYTAGHQRRVGRLADMVGRRLGLDDDMLQGIYVGAMLHDIGKMSIPSTILTKPGALSKEEWGIIRAHPMRGHSILADANLPWPVADMAMQHHERLDGSGYPGGVTGDELGTEVRILAACDVLEAMSSNRPYRPALPMEEARREVMRGRGTRFDSEVANAIVELIDAGQIQPSTGYEGIADDRL